MDVNTIRKKYSFFKDMDSLEIFIKQQDNKTSKYFLRNDTQYYILAVESMTDNRKTCQSLEILKPIYGEKIPEILEKEKDNRYVIYQYIGNGKGKSLYCIEKENIEVDSKIVCQNLDREIKKLHQWQVPTKELQKVNWYRSMYQEFYRHTKRLKQLNFITEEQANTVMRFLMQNKEYLQNVKLSYIHGDLTAKNTCINLETKELYFIDFDMFQIGDPFIDYSKIIWSQKTSKIFQEYSKKYLANDKEDIHLLYCLKIKLFWLPFGYRKKCDYINSLKETYEWIEEARKRLK